MKFKWIVLFAGFILNELQIRAQFNFEALSHELTENLKWYSPDIIYSDYESSHINIDSLTDVTERKLAEILTLNESSHLDLQAFPNLHFFASTVDDLNIRFYSFSHPINMKGNEDIRTVMQWRNSKGSLLSYSISSKIPGRIEALHQMNSKRSNLFLISSKDYFTNVQYVIQFKGDNLILDYPAFKKSPFILTDRLNVSFDQQTQELVLALYENIGMDEKTFWQMRSARGNSSFKKLTKSFEDQFRTMSRVSLKFDGRKFKF